MILRNVFEEKRETAVETGQWRTPVLPGYGVTALPAAAAVNQTADWEIPAGSSVHNLQRGFFRILKDFSAPPKLLSKVKDLVFFIDLIWCLSYRL